MLTCSLTMFTVHLHLHPDAEWLTVVVRWLQVLCFENEKLQSVASALKQHIDAGDEELQFCIFSFSFTIKYVRSAIGNVYGAQEMDETNEICEHKIF